MDLLGGPQLERRPATPTVGIRVRTPFAGMLAVRDRLLTELTDWLAHQQLGGQLGGPGHFYLRLVVVDMAGEMDLEVGLTEVRHTGTDRVRPGELPAGEYATLTYRNHALRANKMLLDWVADQGISLDRRSESDGDHFGCRTELYLTDPRDEPRKTRWVVQLSILTTADSGHCPE